MENGSSNPNPKICIEDLWRVARSHRHSYIDVPAVKFKELAATRVPKAQPRSASEWSERAGFSWSVSVGNAQMSSRLIRKYCVIDSVSKGLLQNAITRLGLSAQAYDRILKVSRTLADLEGKQAIESQQVSRRFSIEGWIAT